MKIKDNFKVRKIAGENLIINQGATHSDLTKIISLNPTAVFLWDNLQGKDFTKEEAADLLVEKFGIDKETALKDSSKWIDVMVNEGVIE